MYTHYIGLDWSAKVMAFARMTASSGVLEKLEGPSDVGEFRLYLRRLKGTKILTFEETTTSQWLYTELRGEVDELVVCDPWRNHLLKDGPKTDKLDAEKLVKLLRGNLLKPVFHSGDVFLYMRTLVSGYRDAVQAGVRWKNQRAALFRAVGKSKKAKCLPRAEAQFVLKGIEPQIELYAQEKARYEKEFHGLVRKHRTLRHLTTIPGIGEIGAVKIGARVVDPDRFKSRGAFWSYSGVVRLVKMSGGRSYGKKKSRHCRVLKEVFKTAASSVILTRGQNPLYDYYSVLLHQKGYSDFQARHALSRRIATLALGVMKSGKPFNAKRKENTEEKKSITGGS